MACPLPSRAKRASRAREILRALGFVAMLFGCAGGQLDPRAQRAVDLFECYVAAVEPYVGGALDAAELVREAIAGRSNLPQALGLLGATQDDLAAINSALVACRAAPVAPPVNPRTLAFREPPY